MKKTIKRSISLILCMIMLLGAAPLGGIAELDFSKLNIFSGLHLPKLSLPEFDLPFGMKASAEETTYSGECGDNVTWFYDEAGTLTIFGDGAMWDYSGNNDMPWSSLNNSIVTVDVRGGVTGIGSYAFSGCAANTVNIPATVNYVGKRAFKDCMYLETVNWNAVELADIREDNLGIITWKTCLDFRSDLFGSAGCESESGVNFVFGKAVREIPDYIFCTCDYNETVKAGIADKISKMTNVPFYNPNINIDAYFNGSPEFTSNVGFNLKSVEIPGSVERIGDRAFFGCSELERVAYRAKSAACATQKTYPSSANPYTKEEVNTLLPTSFSGFDFSDFANDYIDTALAAESPFTGSGSKNGFEVIFDGKQLAMDYNTGEPFYAENPVAIPDSIFKGVTTLTGISMDNNVISIGSYAFAGCSWIKDVTIPESVISIGSYAFADCTGLETLNYNAAEVTSSNSDIFSGAGYLTPSYDGEPELYQKRSITVIFEYVSSIPAQLFRVSDETYSPKIGCFYFSNSIESVGRDAFYGITNASKYATVSWFSRINKAGIDNPVTVASGNDFLTDGDWIGFDNLFRCRLESDGDSLAITGVNPNIVNFPAYLIIPSEIEGLPVATIGDNAFSDVYNGGSGFIHGLEGIIISEGIETIGKGAFAGMPILSADLPESLITIAEGAFSNCNKLENCALPKGLEYIGVRAFENTAVADVEIPGTVTDIGEKTFSGCANLKTVTISEGVMSVGKGAFAGCTSITSLKIPGTVTSIGDYAFNYCNFTKLTIPSQLNVASIKNAFKGATASDLNILYVSNNISSYEFEIISSAVTHTSVSVEFGDGIAVIPGNLFRSDNNIKKITVGENVTTVGDYAFFGCKELETLIYNARSADDFSRTGHIFPEKGSGFDLIIGDCTKKIPANFLYFSTGSNFFNIFNSIIYNVKSIYIGKAVESIGEKAFCSCFNVSVLRYNAVNASEICSDAFKIKTGIDVIIGENVVSLPENIFNGVNLYTVKFEPGCALKTIGAYAFYSCSKIKSLELPEGIKSIGDYAFYRCSEIKSLELPEGIESIGDYAFYDIECEYFNIPVSVTYIGEKSFSHFLFLFNRNYCAYYAGSSVNLDDCFKYVCKYKDPETGIVYTDSSKQDLVYCPRDLTGEVVVPQSVKYIRVKAFTGCNKITSVTVPDTVESIGVSAFDGVQAIYYNGFLSGAPWGAGALNPVNENGILYSDESYRLVIGCDDTLSGEVTLPVTVTEVDGNFSAGGENITSIRFTSTAAVKMSPAMLEGCDNIQSVYAPYNTETVNGVTVTYTNGIPESSNEPDQAQSSGGLMLKVKSFVQSLTGSAPDAVTESVEAEIDDNAVLFMRAESDEALTYTVPDGVNAICKKAFANCSNVTVNIPDSVELRSIGENAFFNTANYLQWKNNSGTDDFTVGKYLIKAANMVESDNGVSYNIPSEIKGIADGAFRDLPLTKITTSASEINFIGNEAFADCSELNSVDLPEVKYAGRDVFKGTSLLNGLSEDKPLLKFGKCVYAAYGEITDASLAGVNCIADYAFSDCSKLLNITNTNGVTRLGRGVFERCVCLQKARFTKLNSIEREAFAGCSSLSAFDIPAMCKNFEFDSFLNCVDLELKVNTGNENYIQDEYGVIYSSDGKTIVKCPTGINLETYTVPEKVTRISDFAFRGTDIRLIYIPDGSYGKTDYYDPRNPFEMCRAEYVMYCPTGVDDAGTTLYRDREKTKLVSVSGSFKGDYRLASSVEEIGMYAFAGNPGITSVTLGPNLKKIQDHAFENCTGITEIIIPESVNEIGENAFAGCVNLKKITIKGSVVSLADNAFIHTSPDAESRTEILLINKDTEFHNLNVETLTEADCTHTGENYCNCADCDFHTNFTIPMKPHSYGEDKEISGGRYKRVCSECGDEIIVARSVEPQKIKDGRARLLEWFNKLCEAILEFLTFGLIKNNWISAR